MIFSLVLNIDFHTITENLRLLAKNNEKEGTSLRKISKEGIEVLLDNNILKNTHKGFIDPRRKDESGSPLRIGYYRTVKGRHRYIEDSYANLAEKLLNKRRLRK